MLALQLFSVALVGLASMRSRLAWVIPAAFLDSIVPHCCAAFGTQVARVLVLSLLWAAYEREAQVSGAQCTLIPVRLAEEIQLEWIHAGGIPDINPV